MRIKFVCEKCKKEFDTEEEAFECERKHIEEAERKKKLAEEKSERKKEIDELIAAYLKDYGHYEYSSNKNNSTLLNTKWWF